MVAVSDLRGVGMGRSQLNPMGSGSDGGTIRAMDGEEAPGVGEGDGPAGAPIDDSAPAAGRPSWPAVRAVAPTTHQSPPTTHQVAPATVAPAPVPPEAARPAPASLTADPTPAPTHVPASIHVPTASAVPTEDDEAAVQAINTRLSEVEQALRRIDAGTYGRCEQCGDPIADELLADRPTARQCVSCASGADDPA